MILATYKPGCYFLIEETEILAEIIPSPRKARDSRKKLTWCATGVEEFFDKGIEEVHEIYGFENYPFRI